MKTYEDKIDKINKIDKIDKIDKIKDNTIIYKNYYKKNIGTRKIGHINMIL